MLRVALALAIGVLAAGTSAHAQISSVTGSAGTKVNYTLPTAAHPISSTFGEGEGTNKRGASGAEFNSFVDIGERLVTFESENIGSGPFVSTTSYSTVNIGFNNTSAGSVFSSDITAAGLGFYLADTSSGCLYTDCAPISAFSDYDFGDLRSRSGTPGVGQVGFDFSVSTLSDTGELTTLYQLSGSLTLTGSAANPVIDLLGGASNALDGFTLATPEGSGSQLGYTWDTTPILLNLNNIGNQTLIYKTSVTSYSGASCIARTTICLIAYSGFGDPVGRGGGVENFARGFNAFAGGGETGVEFTPASFRIPTFENGVLSFRANVPEPATWMSLILGFGLLGAALRRRRTLAY